MSELHADRLLQHVAFARRLARDLVGDADLAEDVVQDAWAALLAHPPGRVRSPRAFLATVLRRSAQKLVRSRARRERRERTAARAEALPSAAEQVAAMEVHRRVVEAVLELPPQQRRAVLLRYFDGLSPREIADRSGEPVETVRSRLKRGLARLRARLDDTAGGRASWSAALLPLVLPLSPPRAAAAPLSGVLSMTARAKVALAGAAAVALGAALWRPLPAPVAPPERAAAAPVASPPPSSRGPSAPASGASTPRRPVPLAGGGTASGPRSDAPVAAPPAGSDDGGLRGTLVLVGPSGEPLASERLEGTFRIAGVATPGGWREVDVTGGAFRVEDLRAREVRVTELSLGGRKAYFEEAVHRVEGEAERDGLALRSRWYPPVTLRVLDARTGEDLDGVDVLRGVPVYRGRLHPGDPEPERLLLAGASSPVVLPDSHGETPYWVSAPGYAWGNVRIEHREGGERFVELEPDAASLVVHLPPADPEANLFVRVFRAEPPGAQPVAEAPAGPRVELGGLPPLGDVEVRAEVGHWWDPPRLLGSARTTLWPGARAEVHVELDGGPLSEPPAALAGFVELPAGHGDLDPAFQLRPADGPPMRRGDRRAVELRAMEGAPLRRAFDCGAVTPGAYWLLSSELQFGQRIDVPPAGVTDALVALPELGEVLVRVRDERTGEPLAVDALSWQSASAPDLSPWTLGRLVADPESATYRLLAPHGACHVSLSWKGHEAASRSVDVGPAPREIELATRPLAGFWLKLVDGGTVVPLTWDVSVDVTAIGMEASARRRRVEHGRAWIAASVPGPYEVRIGSLSGYREIPPIVVEATFGDAPEHVVDLRRE